MLEAVVTALSELNIVLPTRPPPHGDDTTSVEQVESDGQSERMDDLLHAVVLDG